MERLRFGLLQAAQDNPNTTRNFRRELDADLVEFDVNNGELPPHTEFDSLVVTGSRASVYPNSKSSIPATRPPSASASTWWP